MPEEKATVDSVKAESDSRDRAEEVLHKHWPFRPRQQQEEGARTYVSFPMDICETSDGFVLTGELPGVSKQNLDIHVAENELTITGRCEQACDEEERILHTEIPGADFRRSLTLSDAVDHDKISAELKDGLLTIRLAKSAGVQPREISIA